MGSGILALSITLQLAAALLAFRLLRDTEWRYAWGAVTLALLLMAGRRITTLYHIVAGDTGISLDLSAELIALVISATMLVGVWLLGPHLRSARDTERSLRSSEQRLRALLDHLPDAVGLMRDGQISGMNASFRRILGFAPDEMMGRSPADFLHPEDRDRAEREIGAVLDGKSSEPNEYRLRHKDGGYVPVEAWSRTVRLDDGPTLLTVFRDIRDRKEREAALRRSERRFLAFMEHLPAVAFIRDRKGHHVFANESFEVALDLEGGEWQGKTNEELFPPDLAEQFSSRDTTILDEQRPIQFEATVPTVEGERIFRMQRFPIFDEEGTLTLLGGLAWDITDQRRTDALQRRLTTVIEQAAELVVITDPDGTIEYVNPAFEEITGYSTEDAVGENPRILQSGEQDEAFYRRMWRTLRSGEPWSSRFVNRRKDGELYHQETTISPVTDPDHQIVGYVGIGHDATHLVQLEERVRHSERMEAIGALTGGVAHDFNNILAVVLSSVELALDTVPERYREAREALTDLKETAEVGADVVRKLLIFSRREPIELKPLDLGEELQEIASTLHRLLPANIHVEFDVESDLPPVRADQSGIQQIVMNLAANARDAIDGEGHFRIAASTTTLTREDNLQFGELETGEHVVMSVSDTGLGMDDKTQRRAFEPFFTTKESGHGTGLGLATVYSLVQHHEGLIHLYSEGGTGTTFRIYLPVTSEHLPDPDDEIDGRERISGEGCMVLLVEDDDALRRTAERMLERLGFDVLVARDGEDGWTAFQDNEDGIDVVVSDLVMPRLGGADLLKKIHERSPDLPLILSSGYAVGESHDAMQPVKEFVDYLQKPWTVKDLSEVIGAALDR